MNPGRLFRELKRRKVFRVAAVYAVVAWLIIQVAATTFPHLGLPGWTITFVIALAVLGSPIALVLAWAFEVTPEGVKRTKATPSERGRPLGIRRGVWFAMGFVVALSLGWVLASEGRFGVAPGPEQSAAGVDAVPEEDESGLDPARVAIAPFVNRTGSAELDPLGRMAADWITRGLIETSAAEVADLSVKPNAASVPTLAQETGAGLVVSGTYYRQGSDVLLSARITDARRGRVLQEIGPIRTPVDDPLSGVERLRQKVSGALAVRLRSAGRPFAERSRQPPAYAAYRAHLEGDAAFERHDYSEAVRLYGRALALDSGYTAPAVMLAYVALNQDRCERVDSIGRALDSRREHIAEYEWAYLARVRALCRGDQEGAYRAARRMKEIAPGSGHAAFIAAKEALRSGRVREAVRGFEAVDPAYRAFDGEYYTRFSWALHLLGRHADEIRLAEQAREQHSTDWVLSPLDLWGWAALDRTEQLQTRMEEVHRSPRPEHVSPSHSFHWLMAEELAWHGHTQAARQIAQEGLDHLNSLPSVVRQTAEAQSTRADLLMLLGRWEEAHAVLERIDPTTHPSPHVLLRRLGLAAAHAGEPEIARRLLRRLESVPRPANEPLERSQAVILAALGERTRALDLLHQAARKGYRPVYAHAQADLTDLWNDAGFRELVSPRN